MSDPAHSDALDAHLDAIRERERHRHVAAHMRDLANRQHDLLESRTTADDVIYAIRAEAAHLEEQADRIDQNLRSFS